MWQRWRDPASTGSDQDRWVHARRQGPAVYVRTLKAASELVWRSLEPDWQITTWRDIDWHQDRVWSVIRHPVIRRAAGMAEYIQRQGAADWCWHLESLQNLMQWCPALDEHSAPVTWYYGGRAQQIQWIPMVEQDAQVLCDRVDQWLIRQGLAPRVWQLRALHRGDRTYQRVKQWIMESWLGPERWPDWCRTAMEPDWLLWLRACDRWGQDPDPELRLWRGL